jgi:hypothetical protein
VASDEASRDEIAAKEAMSDIRAGYLQARDGIQTNRPEPDDRVRWLAFNQAMLEYLRTFVEEIQADITQAGATLGTRHIGNEAERQARIDAFGKEAEGSR